jgi:uncharacterized cupin superfamily protein
MSSEGKKKPNLIRASELRDAPDASYAHPLNASSKMSGHMLGRMTGLERVGFNIIRIPPGKESFVYHRHFGEEEFLYILSGRGIAEIGDEEHEVGPGDFMGFPTPSVGHHLRNPFEEDLVYISGGERRPTEIAAYPRLGKILVRAGDKISIFEASMASTFPGYEEVK